MFNSKYSKVLTGILIIAIIGIIALLIYVGIDWYKAYTASAGLDDGIDQFDGYVNNVIADAQTNTEDNTTLIEPEIDENSTTNTTTSTSNSTSKPTYKGYNMIGKIEIPAIDLEYPVLENATSGAIEVSVARLYGPGINEVGNTVIIGHNYRNGTFFSNNKKLELGDKIYLTDLEGTKISYTIYKKYTTETSDFDYADRDTDGKREITLSTCTDDGDERLIIWAKED